MDNELRSGNLFGISKFHKYVFGRGFVVWTDKKPLLGLLQEGRSMGETSCMDTITLSLSTGIRTQQFRCNELTAHRGDGNTRRDSTNIGNAGHISRHCQTDTEWYSKSSNLDSTKWPKSSGSWTKHGLKRFKLMDTGGQDCLCKMDMFLGAASRRGFTETQENPYASL